MEILPQLLVNSLIAGSIYALASSGLSLTYGLLRILNFAHGPVMMVGVYFFYFANVKLGLGIAGSGILTLAFAFLLACFILRVFVFPFIKYSYLLVLVTTLALSSICESVISMLFGVNVKSLPLENSLSSFEIYGVYITALQIVIVVSALVLLTTLAFFIHCTSVGRKIRALSEQAQSAESIGISQRRMSYVVFVLALVLAIYAGVLVGYETNMQPTMGSAYTIKAFAAMILGGLGNIWGAVLGSYLLGLVENLSIGLDFGSISIPAGYKDAFAFMVILFVLLFKPEGLFTSRKRAV